MKWVDSREIAIALADRHPDVDPARVNFVDLVLRVPAQRAEEHRDAQRPGVALGDAPEELDLEAVQAAWMEEAD